MLLLLYYWCRQTTTTTPATYRKWMKQSGGKFCFSTTMYALTVCESMCVWECTCEWISFWMFYFRLGVRNEHKNNSSTTKLKALQISICIAVVVHLPFNRSIRASTHIPLLFHSLLAHHSFSSQCAYAYNTIALLPYFSSLEKSNIEAGKNIHTVLHVYLMYTLCTFSFFAWLW